MINMTGSVIVKKLTCAVAIAWGKPAVEGLLTWQPRAPVVVPPAALLIALMASMTCRR